MLWSFFWALDILQWIFFLLGVNYFSLRFRFIILAQVDCLIVWIVVVLLCHWTHEFRPVRAIGYLPMPDLQVQVLLPRNNPLLVWVVYLAGSLESDPVPCHLWISHFQALHFPLHCLIMLSREKLLLQHSQMESKWPLKHRRYEWIVGYILSELCMCICIYVLAKSSKILTYWVYYSGSSDSCCLNRFVCRLWFNLWDSIDFWGYTSAWTNGLQDH